MGNLLIHHQCAASTWMIAPERPPHTSLLVERRQSDEANQCMGMIRRPWCQRPNEKFGIFYDHRVSGTRFNVWKLGVTGIFWLELNWAELWPYRNWVWDHFLTGFGRTWDWVINDRIKKKKWTILLLQNSSRITLKQLHWCFYTA